MFELSYMKLLISWEIWEYSLDLAKSKCDSQLKAPNLGILLRANSAAHLETFQNRFYNWILQETFTFGIVYHMLKW